MHKHVVSTLMLLLGLILAVPVASSEEPGLPPAERPAPPSPAAAGADHFVNPKVTFLLQAGIMLPADNYLWVNKPDEGGDGLYWSVGVSPTIGARIAYWFSDTSAFETYLDLINMPSESGNQRTLLSFGLALKFGIINRADWQARLGGGCGVNVFSAEVLDDWGVGTAVGIDPFALFEIAIKMGDSMRLVFGYHFNSMVGGTQDKATWPPLHIVTLGIEY